LSSGEAAKDVLGMSPVIVRATMQPAIRKILWQRNAHIEQQNPHHSFSTVT
jgi:hypothetical protein